MTWITANLGTVLITLLLILIVAGINAATSFVVVWLVAEDSEGAIELFDKK